MQRKNQYPLTTLILVLVLVSLACGAQPTPEPTATATVVPSKTPRPSATPRPTITPNLAATQRMTDLNAEAQSYFDKGYLMTAKGRFTELDDFNEEWAQLGWYNWWILDNKADDFYMSAHFKWSSAYKNSDISGCGFIFGIQDNNDHYAVFLDRSRILFIDADMSSGGGRPLGTTRGTNLVTFDDNTEADFAVIVKGTYSYVLVNNEVVGEYTLAQSRPLYGNLGLTLLSGTNKDYGTRCEMTELHLWVPLK
ncbi:MAG: hypothetical protein K8S20_02535 [Chloroflexi bacterium]|nr:hypothetical protein [Chloroflexota bacterium]